MADPLSVLVKANALARLRAGRRYRDTIHHDVAAALDNGATPNEVAEASGLSRSGIWKIQRRRRCADNDT